MTRITDVIKTYDDSLTHDGYFVLSNNYPMRWVDVRRWAWLEAHPTALTLRLDHTLSGLVTA